MLTKYQNANSKLGLGSKPVAVIYASNKLGFFHLPVHVSFTLSKRHSSHLFSHLPQVQRDLSARPTSPLVDRNGTIPGSRFMPQAFPSTSSFAQTSQA